MQFTAENLITDYITSNMEKPVDSGSAATIYSKRRAPACRLITSTISPSILMQLGDTILTKEPDASSSLVSIMLRFVSSCVCFRSLFRFTKRNRLLSHIINFCLGNMPLPINIRKRSRTTSTSILICVTKWYAQIIPLLGTRPPLLSL